ncbi:integrin alpha-L isoform X4 [Oreochromis niloticus]|uniref:integrin alpha-L isoform X4 n=1 Tax=Oreochromis niloticus TaxID=8128 RepID=UPI000904A4C6|nr:integrin alpha-L isoform X4 [Oreochromis niloticus]
MKLVWLICTVAVAISVCLAFNIDTTATRIFTTEQKDFFQNKVLQLLSDKNNGTLVTAPEQLGPEETCTSDLNLTHRCIIVPEISPADSPIPIRHFGLSISEDAMRSQITVCSPSAVHPHSGNSSLNKVCYKMKLDRGPSTQEQTNKSVEVVFLFDGSASMTEAEFNKNKDFIVEIMESHRDTPVTFAAVQFSNTVHKVFDFNDYEDGRALEKLMKEKHLKSLTMTHRALEFVLDEIFDNNATGASPDVTKVLVLITDGDPSDTDRNGIIKRYDDKNIIRLVVGVRAARLDKFRAIASEPKHRNAFKIEDFDGLIGVLENLQEKIFTVEGCTAPRAEFSGFSAVFKKVCSTTAVSNCSDNSYLNIVCHQIPNLQQTSASVGEERTNKSVEVVFLFDGSASLDEREFNKIKDFIVEIMGSLRDMPVTFAAVQFSRTVHKVFDFNDYAAGRALDKLMKEKHLKSLTMTHRALEFVLDEIFDNNATGASPDVTKVLVLITDGDPSDTDSRGIIKRYDDKNIIRLVVGVKDAKLDKFRAIASEPKHRNAFKIEDYDVLTGVLENLQEKIFTAQGCTAPLAEFSGFSAVFKKVCSTTAVSNCSDNSYLNIVCHQIPNLQQTSSSVVEERTNKSVEAVFLFDGSASLDEREFNKIKDFIVEIMGSLRDTPVTFAAVQFSNTVHKVFDFNDYAAGRALDKLMKEKHLKSLTMTHRALEFVLDEIFDNNATGASPDVTKVLILITDGDPSDTDSRGIIKRYDDKNIIRLVVGVKDAKLDKFRAIASEPKHRNAFKIEDYDVLTGVLENLQEKIFTVEGCTAPRAEFSGFSAVFRKDSLIVGSVGLNSWRSFLRRPQERMQGYLGNSISIGKKNGVPLYFTGAPEFEQTGQVVFRHHCEQWTELQRIRGEQIGSYFGAELCSLDVDSDGSTDFLLVGAPQFHLPQVKKEGRVYIYSVSDETVLESNQDVTGPSMGRFGTTISSLPDLNGDGLRDVAVGAPLEDDNRGAVYIYHGNRQRGIVSTFSQRIMGKNIDNGLKFFGRAIFGDVGEDGLPGVVVESHGAAVVFRSKPVFNVLARLSFHPENLDTLSPDTNVALVKITACFAKVEATKSKAGSVSSALNITYILNVMGQASQSMFSQTLELRDENTCVSYSINRANYVADTSTPLRIRLNFLQPESESAVLSVDSEREAVLEIPI